jgi:hypothetical protein
MKRKIIIFVTILFVALALNGFAHNRQNRHEAKRPCPCELNQVNPMMNHFNGKKHEIRPFKEQSRQFQRRERKFNKKFSVSVKNTINGKTAMVIVGSPLTPYEVEHLQLLN